MKQDYAVIVFVELTSDILVPHEWPLCQVHRIVLDLTKVIITQSDHEDPVLQVNGIPARIHRYVDYHGFFYVFKKILSEEMHGSYVYDITFSEDINNNKIGYSSGTRYKESRPSNCSCSGHYIISCYQVPPRTIKRKALNISANETKVKRMYQPIHDKCVSHD